MMCLSHTTGYAVHALACIALENGKPCFVRDVAACAKMPKPYLAKIINSLAHHGLVLAKRGYRGGISLSRAPGKISLLEVVEAVEGKNWIGPCLLGLDDCASRRVCPTKLKWEGVRRQIVAILHTTTLADIVPLLKDKQPRRQTRTPVCCSQGNTAR
jgi:Rrf2 family iron-sulfur cluster assembly transcriptional regulator